MATDPGNVPPSPTGPPTPPSPGASREEWREWRRQQRYYFHSHGHLYGPWGWFGAWAWFWALALILIGGYYLLSNLGIIDLPRAGEVLWPALLILLGVILLVTRLGGNRS